MHFIRVRVVEGRVPVLGVPSYDPLPVVDLSRLGWAFTHVRGSERLGCCVGAC